MRNLTWLFRWSNVFNRALPIALLAGLGFASLPAVAANDPPAPVLKLTHQRPQLRAPAQASEKTTEAPKRAPAPVAKKTPTAVDQAPIDEPPRIATVSDGWVPRKFGTVNSLPQASNASPTQPNDKPGQPSGAAASTDNAGSGLATSPTSDRSPVNVAPAPGVPAPSMTAPSMTAPSATAPIRAKSSSRNDTSKTEGGLNTADGLGIELKPVPRLTLGTPQDSQPAEELPNLQAPQSETAEPPVAEPLDEQFFAAEDQLEQAVPIEREELPIRRPRIESRPGDRNQRSRDLQEQLEQFERQTVRPSDPIAEDEYDNPQIDPDLEADVEADIDVDVEADNDADVEAAPAPEKPARVIPAAALRLQAPIAQCLQYYYQRPENARDRTPWGMLHAILPYGTDAQIDTGKRRFNAIAWLAGNNPCRNLKMLTVTREGALVAREGVGLQGHQAQMLAIFAQVGVPVEYPLYANGRKFSINDLIRSEMGSCKAGNELTFTLIGLSNYLPTDTRWRTSDGQVWDFERLLREEMAQPVVGAACGGTHRLMGFSYALQQRRREGLPMTGQWARAEKYVNDFVSYAWQLQNRDGSFSTDWFEGQADNGDVDRKLQTSGHILEWLLFTMSDEELADERVTRAVTFVANTLISGRNRELQVGPKGHALRALSLYHRRMFNSQQPWIGQDSRPTSSPRAAQVRRRSR